MDQQRASGIGANKVYDLDCIRTMDTRIMSAWEPTGLWSKGYDDDDDEVYPFFFQINKIQL